MTDPFEYPDEEPDVDGLANLLADAQVLTQMLRQRQMSSVNALIGHLDEEWKLVFGENVRVEHHWRAEERAVWERVV